jgi:Holliday junction resolvase RusA-like endonuclease
MRGKAKGGRTQKKEVVNVINFVVYGEPVPQGRPRTAVVNGRAIVYDPKKSRDFKRDIKRVAQDYVPEQLITGPIVLEVKVFRSIPKSFSKKKREKALAGIVRPTTKPDLKNYIAGVEDALEKVIFENDSQIVSYGESGKWYGDPPRIEITIREIEEEDSP